ncbi:hypothetical protein DPMN_145267 [Dreissena polymorpha]|uniref:Uncharacterized protein n=1 Tax=Dreissena polymorpha TaxID=45954 RepID=A0A9D4F9J1_DREPO|nr:hypothetical protein DPMN_145267 [Dreissena polymorpha]
MEIVDKRETELKSNIMEREGIKRSMADISSAGIEIGEIVTDASTTIAALISCSGSEE